MNTCPTCPNDLVCHDLGECLARKPEPAPDYGEPWDEQHPPHPIAKDKGVYWLNPEQFNRAVACVNACAGMTDPASHLAAMREAIREAFYSFADEPESDASWLLNDRQRTALTKLQPFLDQ